MARVYRTLINTEAIYLASEMKFLKRNTEYDDNREDLCKKIFNTVTSELFDYLENVVDIMDDEDFCNSDCFVLGFEDPAALINEAEEWNSQVFQGYDGIFDYFDDMRVKLHCVSFKETFQKLEGLSKENQRRKYEKKRQELGQLLSSMNGQIQCGSYGIVMEIENPGSCCKYSFSAKMSEKTLENLKAHPEQYAIIEVYYK